MRNKILKKRVYVFAAALLVILLFAIFYINQSNKEDVHFTKEKWDKEPSKRIEIVDDLQARYSLKGMSKEEVINLLGEPQYKYEPNVISYYLGEDGLGMDSILLDITLDKNNKVESYAIQQH